MTGLGRKRTFTDGCLQPKAVVLRYLISVNWEGRLDGLYVAICFVRSRTDVWMLVARLLAVPIEEVDQEMRTRWNRSHEGTRFPE